MGVLEDGGFWKDGKYYKLVGKYKTKEESDKVIKEIKQSGFTYIHYNYKSHEKPHAVFKGPENKKTGRPKGSKNDPEKVSKKLKKEIKLLKKIVEVETEESEQNNIIQPSMHRNSARENKKYISKYDFARIANVEENTIRRAYQRNKETIGTHSWLQEINSRKQRVFDEFAAKIIMSDLKIPVTEEFREKLKEAKIDLMKGEYIHEDNLSSIIPKLNSIQIEQLKTTKEISYIKEEVNLISKKIENEDINRFVQQGLLKMLKKEIKDEQLIKTENKMKVYNEIYIKLSDLSLYFEDYAKSKSYKKGIYAEWNKNSFQNEAKELLYNLFLSCSEAFEFVEVKDNKLLCSLTGKIINNIDEFIPHHVLWNANYPKLDWNHIYIPITKRHRIFPVKENNHPTGVQNKAEFKLERARNNLKAK